MPTPSGHDCGDQRRALRRAVRLCAQLRDRGSGGAFDIDVVDLSLTGFRAETSFTLWPGTTVWLRMPGFSALEAKVAWRDGFRYGCAFAQPLHPAVFDHIVRMADD